MNNNELMTITLPNGDRAVAQEMHDYVVRRERELKAEFAAIAEKLTPEHYTETKSVWTRLKKMDAELKSIIERVERGSREYSATDGLLFQLAATRKNLKALYIENWEKFVALRDANLPPPEMFEYVVEFHVTPDTMDKLAAKFAKDGIEFRARRVLDNEHARIDKLFADKDAPAAK